jgi:tRNA threonylcarbamoyladenosine biosynthesis protein TsaE
MKKIIYTEHEIMTVVQQLLTKIPNKILAFHGPMGAGKTTLIKALVKELGGTGTVNSPTFGIVNEYHFENGKVLGYHFDFYRLKSEIEALDMGLEDYLDQNVWIFMEWPEKIASLLPTKTTKIEIEVVDLTTRSISW